jgi:cell division protein FtsI/penicillin-binding protein 2/outer membrane protein assembly factor BamB
MGRYRSVARWGVPIGVAVAVLVVAVVTSLRSGDDATGADSTVASGIAGTAASTTIATLPAADPSEAASRFLDAWTRRDWPALESVIGRNADVASAQHAAWFADLAVSSLDLELESTTLQATDAVVTYVVEVGVGDAGVWRYRGEVDMIPAGDGWLVDWTPSALHPSLGTGDHLEVSYRWPDRAPIADIGGRALVTDEPEVIVGIIPGRVESRDTLAAEFQTHLGISRATIDGLLDAPGVQPDWYLPVTRVDRATYVTIRPPLYPIPGVAFRVDNRRVPAHETLGAELLGTTGEITAELLDVLGPPYEVGLVVGRSGMERAFETVLAGSPTIDIIRRSPDGDDVVVHGFPGAAGETVTAGLQLEAQYAAEAVVATAGLPVAIVAIDIATGEVRAAASSPAGGFNEALSGLYPPGSTFKIIVATAALEAGIQRSDMVACPETVTISGKVFSNAVRLPTSLTLEQAFARSCNTAFIELGTSLDPAALLDVAKRYGFDVEYTVGLASAGGQFDPSGDSVEFAASMIGQGRVLVSPLHMASVAATAAAGAWRVPSIVAGGDGQAIGEFDTAVMADLRAMMRAVVAGGTGSAAAISGRDIAGKTGTAQIGEGDDADTIAWFVGFDEELAFAVAVDGGSSGGGAAAPLARDFLLALDEPLPEPAGAVVCLPSGSDWATFQGSNSRVGCSDAPALTNPVVAWRSEVGTQAWLNSPLVLDNTVIVGSAGSLRAGPDAEDGVYALRLSDGRFRWRFSTANDVNGIAATDGIVVVAGDEGAVWGLSVADGTELWRVDTGANVFGYPVIVGDQAVVGDALGTLWAIGLDGEVRWTAALNGAIRGGPATDGVVIYAVSDLGDVGAFSLDGFEIWREQLVFETNAGSALTVVYASPTIVGDRLVVTFTVEGGPGSPGLVAFDRFIGSIGWWGNDPDGVSETRWANVRSSVAVAPGGLVMASSLSAGVQLISEDTGRARWAADSGVTCGRQWASPIVTSDTIVLARPDGAVYGFDAETGTVRWRIPTPSTRAAISNCSSGGIRVADSEALEASAAVAPDGTIVVASIGNEIFAIRDG